MWNNSLRKAGFMSRDKQTNHRRMHPHVLRKFFRTKLGSVIPVDVVEALMGHEGYLTEVYRRYTEEDLAQFYKQGEHALLIFAEAAEVGRLRQEIEDRNRQLQTLVNGLTADNMTLKSENLDLKSRTTRLESDHLDFKRKMEKRLEQILEKVRGAVEE